jgi:hypothetical protein
MQDVADLELTKCLDVHAHVLDLPHEEALDRPEVRHGPGVAVRIPQERQVGLEDVGQHEPMRLRVGERHEAVEAGLEVVAQRVGRPGRGDQLDERGERRAGEHELLEGVHPAVLDMAAGLEGHEPGRRVDNPPLVAGFLGLDWEGRLREAMPNVPLVFRAGIGVRRDALG